MNLIKQSMTFKGYQDNYSSIRSLIKMAKSDGLVNLSELTYIVWFGQKLGLSKNELMNLADGEKEISAPFGREERLNLFYEIITMMYVDGQVHEEEIAQCKEMAVTFKLENDAINNLITHIQANQKDLISREEFDSFF